MVKHDIVHVLKTSETAKVYIQTDKEKYAIFKMNEHTS